MHTFEKCCASLRHFPLLEEAEWLWKVMRPSYERILRLLTNGVVERVINGSDCIRLPTKLRQVGEVYEPLVWKHLMAGIREGNVVVDVGAYIGLYTIALAKRVGTRGRVVALEPNPMTFEELKQNIHLNGVRERVKLVPAAVGAHEGRVLFETGRESESHVATGLGILVQPIEMTTLDQIFRQERIDVMKIDVEGYEEEVLKGGRSLLQDRSRAPQRIYIEVHPFAWHNVGTTSDSLLDLLKQLGYQVFDLESNSVHKIESYGEVIAYKNGGER